MPASEFKVGDKVRAYDLAIDNGYGSEVHSFNDVINSEKEIFTISDVDGHFCKIEGSDLWWSDTILEPAEKTLDNLRTGDLVKSGGGIRKVLAAVDGCYLLSNIDDYITAGYWYTTDDLKRLEYSIVEPVAPEPTIKIDGKKYKKSDVEKAIKDLEVVDCVSSEIKDRRKKGNR